MLLERVGREVRHVEEIIRLLKVGAQPTGGSNRSRNMDNLESKCVSCPQLQLVLLARVWCPPSPYGASE